MAFDAMVDIEGLTAGNRTRAEGLVGFLHLAHQTLPAPGQPISEYDLAALVLYQGAIGGPVDAEINIANSGFRARAIRIEVDVAEKNGQPVFVAAVRTIPVFSAAGAWSVVKAPGTVGEPGADTVAALDGAPIIRKGVAKPTVQNTVNALTTAVCRIADASDLFSNEPGNPPPRTDYGLLQGDSTHRFLFRRPEILPGKPRIVSSISPVFADFFAASSSKGLFPPLANAIELVDQTYVFIVQAGTGYLELSPSVDLPSPRPDLVLSETASDQFRIAYGGSRLEFKIEPQKWHLAFPGIEVWTERPPTLPNMTGARITILGGTGQRAQLDNIEPLLSPVLEDLLSILPFMDSRGSYGPVDLGASNLKISPKISVGIDKVFPDPEVPFVAIRLFALLEIGIKNELKKSDEDLFLGLKTGYEARFSIPIATFPVAVIFGWSITLGGKIFLTGSDAGKAKGIIEMRIYVGLAFGKDLSAFKAYVATGAGLIIVEEGGDTGIGGFIFLEINIKLSPVVKVKVFGEFACLQIEKSDGSEWHRWAGQVGVNVSIFMIISIKFTTDISDEKQIGP